MSKFLKIVLIALLIVFCMPQVAQSRTKKRTTASPRPIVYDGVVNEITPSEFAQLVANWRSTPNKFRGNRPAVVDIYAPWCGPCKRLSPILDKLARRYCGIVDFYRINGDEYKQFANKYYIRAFPTVMIWTPGFSGTYDWSEGLYELDYYVRNIDAAISIYKQTPSYKKSS